MMTLFVVRGVEEGIDGDQWEDRLVKLQLPFGKGSGVAAPQTTRLDLEPTQNAYVSMPQVDLIPLELATNEGRQRRRLERRSWQQCRDMVTHVRRLPAAASEGRCRHSLKDCSQASL
jgi:hypothetical protein